MEATQKPLPRTTRSLARRPVKIKASGLDAQLNLLAHQLGVTLNWWANSNFPKVHSTDCVVKLHWLDLPPNAPGY